MGDPCSMDVSGTVAIGDWVAVCGAVSAIFAQRFPGCATAQLRHLYHDIAALYRGEHPDFHACDIAYHDLCHVLDVSLAMARLLNGHERCHAGEERFGFQRALLGITVSLCHDTGYLIRRHDTRHHQGAEYTRTHVSRSGRHLYLQAIARNRARLEQALASGTDAALNTSLRTGCAA